MKIIQCDQGPQSPEWLMARTGRVTASEVGDAISFLKRKGKDGREAGDSSAAREAYKAAIIGEILTGRSSEHYVSRWMERGTEMEPFARSAYEDRFDVLVDRVGFIVHPTIDRSGSSPDGLMLAERGGVEIKVPKIETHIKYTFANILPPEYEPQVMWNIACSELDWWDFISFCPELPERHQIFRKRVYRDDTRIAEMEAGVLQFLAEADETIEALNLINPELAPQPTAPDPMAWAAEAQLSNDAIDAFFDAQEQA